MVFKIIFLPLLPRTRCLPRLTIEVSRRLKKLGLFPNKEHELCRRDVGLCRIRDMQCNKNNNFKNL